MSSSPKPPLRDRLRSAGTGRRAMATALVLSGVVAVAYIAAVAATAVLLPDCARCHMVGEFAAETQRGAHAALECSSCHGGSTPESRIAFANAQVLGMYLNAVDLDRTLSSVSSVTCLRCHDSGMSVPVESAGLRILHFTCAVDRECTECHSPTAHGRALAWPRSSTMEMCFDCHGASGVSDDCELCHTDRLPRDRIRTGSFAVTHGPNYMQTHGMGNMRTCGPCHEPSRCAECHGAGLPHGPDFMTTHGRPARSTNAKCVECHTDSFCIDCHGYEMPHPPEFLPEHASVVDDDGEDGCRRCHAERDCTLCHEKHVHPTTLDQLRSLGVLPDDE